MRSKLEAFWQNRVLAVVLWPKRHWKLALVLLVIAGLVGWWWYRQVQASKPVYSFANPEYRDLVDALEVSGVVDAKEKARLRFMLGGKLTFLGVRAGETVKKWQTLASIDRTTLQKQLQQDLNAYLKERYNDDYYIVDTKDKYWEQSVVRTRTDNQLDLENEVLDVEIRDIAIRDTSLYAPFAGVVTVVPATTAGVQLLSSEYFEIINPDTLLFRAEVDEADIPQVSEGQRAEINLDAYPDQTIATEIAYISFTSSQTANGTVFLVEMPIPNPDLSLYRLGMNGDVSIVLERKLNVLTVPLLATRQRDGKTYVDVKDGEGVTEREIQVGLESDEYVEVLGGVSESDQVVIPE